MNKKNFGVLLLAILFTLTMLPFGFSINIVSNGSFETGDNTDWNGVVNADVIQNDYNLVFGTASYLFEVADGSFMFFDNIQWTGDFDLPLIDRTFCTTAIINPNEVIDYNFHSDYASTNTGTANTITESYLSGNRFEKTFIYLTNNPNDLAFDGSGNENVPSGKFGEEENDLIGYKSGTLTNDNNTSYLCVAIGTNRVASGTNANTINSYVIVDDFQVTVRPSIELTVTEPDEPLDILEDFIVLVVARNSVTNAILSNTDINLNMTIATDSNVDLNYSGGTWTYNNTGLGVGDYDYSFYSSGTNFNAVISTGTIEVKTNLTNNISYTNIDNASGEISRAIITINPNLYSGDVEFKVENVSSLGVSLDVNYSIINYLDDGKQYFIYTSNDGENYTLNSTLTFGSSNYNPIQKIYDTGDNKYNYDFQRTLSFGEVQYFKLIYEDPAQYWGKLLGSSDWINRNPPSKFDDDGKIYDLFNGSSLTPIYSYTRDDYPNLTSVDLTTGFYILFTAYADSPTDLNVGYIIGSIETTTNINIGTVKQTFRVTVDPTDNNAQIFFGSGNTALARVYITDYSIVPISYFSSNLELLDFDFTKLNTIVNGGTNKKYINEMLPFVFRTSFYDRDKDLKKLIIDVLVSGTIVKSYAYDLSDHYEVSMDLQGIVDGIIDYSGKALDSEWNVNDLKTVVVKATLVNSSDQNVEEQYNSIYLLQYPFFSNEFTINTSPLNKKVGEEVSFNMNLIQKYADAFIGLDIRVFDKDKNRFFPDYQTIIYADELGCTNLIQCSKNIVLDEFNYLSADNYFLSVGALLTTEEQDFTNFLTYNTTGLIVSDINFHTARLLQLFERRDLNYNTTEQIPLVLQVKTDKLENISNDYKAVLQIDVNVDGTGVTHTLDLNFAPQKFIYDEKTGYNYFFWNTIFFDENGDLLDSGDYLKFKAYLIPLTEKSTRKAYGLTNKCVQYPSDFSNGTLLMDWIGLIGDATYGCTVNSPNVVEWDSAYIHHIQLDDAYNPKSNQNHSVFCYRSDIDKSFKMDLGDEFVCGVAYRKSEQMIDGFKITLGNQYSDYALVGTEQQYISFEIAQEEVMFNDILFLQKALESEFNTQTINTYGELLSAGINSLLPYGQGIVDTASLLAGEGFITDVGFDVNLEGALDPNLVSGIFFFKVSGLSVINIRDYFEFYPELEELDPIYFRRFMNDKIAPLNFKKASVLIYSDDSKQISSFKIPSTIVISEKASPTANLSDDSNNTKGIIPSALKFNFIVDMYSNNQQNGIRAYVPIVFSYGVYNPLTLGSLLSGFNEMVSNPAGWFANNWFIIVVLIILILIISLVYANFKGGGSITINNSLPRADLKSG